MLKFVSILFILSSSVVPSNTRWNIKEAPRILCHEEWDYIESKAVSVCGGYTRYPETIYGISHSDSKYTTWLANGNYSKKVERVSYKDGKNYYPADIYLPTNIDTSTLKAKITTLVPPQDVKSITRTYQITKSIETSMSHSGSVSLGLQIANALKSLIFKIDVGYTFSYSTTNYVSETYTISSTFENSFEYFSMGIIQYQVYLPVKVVMYKPYGPASYIFKENFESFKVLDVAIRYWPNKGFTDPWNIRGFVEGKDISNDYIQPHPSL